MDPRLSSAFALYWEFGDVEVRNSQIDLLTTQRLGLMHSPCLTPLSPSLYDQQSLIVVCFCASKSLLCFCTLLGIRRCWSSKFPNWLAHYSTATTINGQPLSDSIVTAIARPTIADRSLGVWLQVCPRFCILLGIRWRWSVGQCIDFLHTTPWLWETGNFVDLHCHHK